MATAKLIIASSLNSDMRYAAKANLPDPFIYLEVNGHGHVFVDSREYDWCQEHCPESIAVHLTDGMLKKLPKQRPLGRYQVHLAGLICRQRKIKNILMTPEADSGDVEVLRQVYKIKVKLQYPLFPKREIKSPSEVKEIKKVAEGTVKAFSFIKKVLRDSKISSDKKLRYKGKPLTSEWLKKEISHIFLDYNLDLQHGMIISGGRQAAIPHHPGYGVLKAHQSIVCDIFPRSSQSGYFFDMTRTFCKGEAPKKLVAMHQAVLRGQQLGLDMVKSGVPGYIIHQAIHTYFKDLGFETKNTEGFTHGTGHGVGLDIHEAPTIGELKKSLPLGSVVTVEPGLYYKRFGGVRIEDTVLVTKSGHKEFVQFPKSFLVK
ncbi:MAG: hypothetical protein COT81_04870 [Candidatus Buchananbacteria bacterium CG10_big_fil_rev_8_21_14_0_10_42_9]|uniref:Peptidase M24 domain-containing protein n=1 Tax=Candidatus Buchananbacteria bacterium CG10_big_fil_rev_8_21_14_0_10_42_9 TaxID=1974526 RepID=A0A2H0W048_9BACT|nr:MAG: hypothetical protein COT81_04870 [Candidatus Buchananbacteria bacterium CG10_big_fil_rev_8_21_14_0_10_42_9]